MMFRPEPWPATWRSLYLAAAAFVMAGCLGAEDPETDGPAVVADGDYVPVIPVLPAGWPTPWFPSDNPFTPAKAILGRRLFFETGISRTEVISCAWCHAPATAFADRHQTPLSTGVDGKTTHRNSPTLANLVFASHLMFEGGVPTLEQQALAPLHAENEMDMTGPEIEAYLAADTAYVRMFEQAFGPGPVTLAKVTKALATYQRTLISYRSPYDRWASGDTNALSPAARRGAELFLGEKGDCWHCHAPPLFTNSDFHNIGLDPVPRDLGRALVTGKSSDEGKFKTPTLRNVWATPPYMHDGRFATLQEVVEHYNSGGVSTPNRDPLLRPLGLTYAEIQDLVAFLEALTDHAFLAEPNP